MSARESRRAPGNNNTVRDSTSQGYGANRIYANVWLNGRSIGKAVLDTGADITVISASTAKAAGINTANSTGSINIQGVASNTPAPLVPVSMKIESQPAFSTTIAVTTMSLPFNLIAMKDATRVYNVNITAGGTQLIPKAQVAAAGGDNMLPPIEITHGMPSLDLNLTPAQIKVVVAAFIILMAVAAVD